MKHFILGIITILAIQTVQANRQDLEELDTANSTKPMLQTDTVSWVINALQNYDSLTGSRADTALLIVQQAPRDDYKKALKQFFNTVFFEEQPNSTRLRLCFLALMAYNDRWSFNGIAYYIGDINDGIIEDGFTEVYTIVSKCFCDTYDEVGNAFYEPLRKKYSVPDFIPESFKLSQSNINDFIEEWYKSSCSLTKENNNKAVNQNIQMFYNWVTQKNDKEISEMCRERDSLLATNKRKHRKRIAELENELDSWRREEKACVLPRYINVYYTDDTIANIIEVPGPFHPFGLPCRTTNREFVVPSLTEYNHKKVSEKEGDIRLLLADCHIANLFYNFSNETTKNKKEVEDLLSINPYDIYTRPFIYSIYFFSDGVVFMVNNTSSGYSVFFPNDKSKSVRIFNKWIS